MKRQWRQSAHGHSPQKKKKKKKKKHVRQPLNTANTDMVFTVFFIPRRQNSTEVGLKMPRVSVHGVEACCKGPYIDLEPLVCCSASPSPQFCAPLPELSLEIRVQGFRSS